MKNFHPSFCPPLVSRAVSADARRELSKFVRFQAQAMEHSATACDEMAKVLHRYGNTAEAFVWEGVAENLRANARSNYESAYQLGIAK